MTSRPSKSNPARLHRRYQKRFNRAAARFAFFCRATSSKNCAGGLGATWPTKAIAGGWTKRADSAITTSGCCARFTRLKAARWSTITSPQNFSIRCAKNQMVADRFARNGCETPRRSARSASISPVAKHSTSTRLWIGLNSHPPGRHTKIHADCVCHTCCIVSR